MLAALKPPHGVVTVTRIDRLARSTFDLFAIVKQIAALGVSVEGRNVPPGPTPGARLAAPRKRPGFKQRSLAAALELAPATVNHIENTEASSVAVLCRVQAFLRAGA